MSEILSQHTIWVFNIVLISWAFLVPFSRAFVIGVGENINANVLFHPVREDYDVLFYCRQSTFAHWQHNFGGRCHNEKDATSGRASSSALLGRRGGGGSKSQKRGKHGRRGRRSKEAASLNNDNRSGDLRRSIAENPKGNPRLASSLQPTRTSRVKVCFPRPPPSSNNSSRDNDPIQIYTYEVRDEKWWNHEENSDNPFGARIWPASIAVAEFLVTRLGKEYDLTRFNVLEIGCGTGVPSLAAAACGATVLATDVSPVVLSLIEQGWKSTNTEMIKKKPATRRIQTKVATSSESNLLDTVAGIDAERKTEVSLGTLSTKPFDIYSNLPLPISAPKTGNNNHGRQGNSRNDCYPSSSANCCIVVGSAVMYEASLAVALARRVVEACKAGAWVILGDDTTGEREGGRELFLAELAKLSNSINTTQQSHSSDSNKIIHRQVWSDNIYVKNRELGWRQKEVRLLHLNPPAEITESILGCSSKASSKQSSKMLL